MGPHDESDCGFSASARSNHPLDNAALDGADDAGITDLFLREPTGTWEPKLGG